MAQPARVQIKIHIIGGPTTSLQATVGTHLGAVLFFQTTNTFDSLSQVGRIYYEDQPTRDLNLRQLIREQDNNKTFVIEGTPFPARCGTSGNITAGEVGIAQEFSITTKKNEGGGWPSAISVKGPANDVPATLTDAGDGNYHVNYTPTEEGVYTVSVTFTCTASLQIPAGAMVPDPIQCIAYGPGLEGGEQYKPAVFTIESRNKLGNKIPIGGHNFHTAVKGPFGDPVPCDTVDNGDGTYTATYHPNLPGKHIVDIKLKEDHIKDSPREVMIDYSSETANAAQSYAEGPGLENGVNSTRMKAPATFTIHAVDKNGKHKAKGGDLFDVFIEDPLFDIVAAQIKDNNDGTYTVTYVPKEPGNHTVDIVLRNQVHHLNYEHIKDSPRTVLIKTGVDPRMSTAEGPGLKDGILDTFPAHFTITSRDRDGKPVPEGGDEYVVKITDPKGGSVPSEIVDNNNGTYSVTYHPDIAGHHTIAVTLDNINIKDSPFRVLIKPGAHPPNTFIEGFTFTIRTRDKRDKNVPEGGQNVKASIKDTSGKPINIKFTDRGDGTYHVAYALPMVAGTYPVSCTVDDQEIKGSPWVQSVANV